MKTLKKFLAILCVTAIVCSMFSVASLAFFDIGTAERRAGGSGWATGKISLNGYEYDYNLYITASNGSYTSHCNTQANVVRSHGDLYCKWLTKNDGYQEAVGGNELYAYPTIGTTSSKAVSCPVGTVKEYTRASTQIGMEGDRIGLYTVVW